MNDQEALTLAFGSLSLGVIFLLILGMKEVIEMKTGLLIKYGYFIASATFVLSLGLANIHKSPVKDIVLALFLVSPIAAITFYVLAIRASHRRKK